MSETFTNSPGENYEADKAAEEISNAARDQVDNADADAQKVYNETAKSPEEIRDQMGTAPKARKKLDKGIKAKNKAQKEKQKKFEIDLDNYTQFVDRVT